MKKSNVISIAGLLLLGWLVVCKPFGESTQGNFSKILTIWSNNQQEESEELTSKAVSGVEGKYVGEHKIKGSNWYIPNILRQWFGVTQ